MIESNSGSRTLQFGLQNGGPAGLIYGFILAWVGQSLQALVMAEMASMYVCRLLPLASCQDPFFTGTGGRRPFLLLQAW